MRDDEANESLREDADADFDAAGGDDTSSPVLRRRPSTGNLTPFLFYPFRIIDRDPVPALDSRSRN